MLDANSGEDISGNISEHGLTCLSWCDSPFESPRLAVGGYSKRAVVFVQNNGKWAQVFETLNYCLFVHYFVLSSCLGVDIRYSWGYGS